MKKILFFTLAITLLLLFSACESGGKFEVHNRTSHPVWTAVQAGDFVEVPAGDSHVFKVDTETQSFLTGEVSKKIKVRVLGKTFSLVDRSEEVPVYTDSTYTKVKAGKTTHAYLSPNRACIQITNLRNTTMDRAEIWQHRSNSQMLVGTLSDIPAGETKWIRVDPNTLDSSFYYRIHVLMENGDVFPFGGPEVVLGSDELYQIDIPAAPGQ